jgi:spermidine/putrescine transport system ATP-binding protein
MREDSTLNGTVDNVVYFGTDTHFHVTLDDGSRFIVRQQNARGGGPDFAAGGRVGIFIGDDAAQVLKD